MTTLPPQTPTIGPLGKGYNAEVSSKQDVVKNNKTNRLPTRRCVFGCVVFLKHGLEVKVFEGWTLSTDLSTYYTLLVNSKVLVSSLHAKTCKKRLKLYTWSNRKTKGEDIRVVKNKEDDVWYMMKTWITLKKME